jgi:hypothetical protein
MTQQSPTFEINYEQIGRFYWNPHPRTPGTKQVDGITYPIGTQVVVVAGKHHVFRPQTVAHVLSTEEHYRLILQNVEVMVGQSSMNDMGIRQISLSELERRGDPYLKEVDARCANILMDTLANIYVTALEKENESRVARNLPPRDASPSEQEHVNVLEGLASRLKKEKSHALDKRLKAIKIAAAVAPDFQRALKDMGITELRNKAAVASIAFGEESTGEELIAKLTAHRIRVEAEAANAKDDEEAEPSDGVEDTGESVEELLDSTVRGPQQEA